MLSTEPQKNKAPNIGIFLLCILAAGALIYFYTYPQYSQYNTLKAQIATNAGNITQLQNEQNQTNQAFQKMSAAQQLSNLDLAIPNTSNVPDLYAYLETLAKASNLSLSTIQATDQSQAKAGAANAAGNASGSAMPDQTAADQTGTTDATGSDISAVKLPSDLGKVNVTMAVKGSVDNFNQFLGALEKSMRFLDVQSIDITEAEDQSTGTAQTQTQGQSQTQATDLTFTLKILTYYSKQN